MRGRRLREHVVMTAPARRLWQRIEPYHAITYFNPECDEAYEQIGLRGFWRGYFAGRAAPLGPVGPGPVYALFYGFARHMVDRALPAVWELTDPQRTLQARQRGARASLERLAPAVPAEELKEAAVLARTA